MGRNQNLESGRKRYLYLVQAVQSSGEGTGTPLQYSCLGNPMDGGAWWAAVHGVAKSWTRLSNLTFTFHFHALEKEMATHSSVLAWRIPGRGVWWATVYEVAQSRTRLTWLSCSQVTDYSVGGSWFCLWISYLHINLICFASELKMNPCNCVAP